MRRRRRRMARSASPIGRSLNRRSANRLGRTDHPGAARHLSSTMRGIPLLKNLGPGERHQYVPPSARDDQFFMNGIQSDS